MLYVKKSKLATFLKNRMDLDTKSAKAFLCKTWTPRVCLNSRHLYAMGNTPVEDLLETLHLEDDSVHVCLLAAGDIRHILYTVANLHPDFLIPGKRNYHQMRKVSFVVNDIDTEILARNVILFEIILRMKEVNKDDMAFLWAVWYNMELSADHFRRLKDIIMKLLKDDIKSNIWSFKDANTKQVVKEVWKRWAENEWDVEQTRSERNQSLEHSKFKLSRGFVEQAGVQTQKTYAEIITEPYIKALGYDVDESVDNEVRQSYYKRIEKEVQNWYTQGTVNPQGYEALGEITVVNPTMMRPDSVLWYGHYGSQPFMNYGKTTREEYEAGMSIVDLCFARLQKYVSYFKKSLEDIQVVVEMYYAESLYACSSAFDADITFDLIHSSTLADHVGLINLLLSAAPRLKGPDSLLLTQSIKWTDEFASLKEYIYGNLGCDASLFPFLFGVKLTNDFNITKSFTKTVYSMGAEAQFLHWKKSKPEGSTAITNDIAQAIKFFTSMYFRPSGEVFLGSWSKAFNTSRQLITPVTLGVLVQNMEKVIEGGVQTLVEIIDQEACSCNCYPLLLNWEIVKTAFGFQKLEDSLVQITLPSGLKVPSGPVSIGMSAQGAILLYGTETSESAVDKVEDIKDCPSGSHLILNYIYNGQNNTINLIVKKSILSEYGDKLRMKTLVDRPLECGTVQHVKIPAVS